MALRPVVAVLLLCLTACGLWALALGISSNFVLDGSGGDLPVLQESNRGHKDMTWREPELREPPRQFGYTPPGRQDIDIGSLTFKIISMDTVDERGGLSCDRAQEKKVLFLARCMRPALNWQRASVNS